MQAGWSSIRSWLQSEGRLGEPHARLKLVALGHGSAGKTTLLRSLSRQAAAAAARRGAAGEVVAVWSAKDADSYPRWLDLEIGEGSGKVSVWDLPGHIEETWIYDAFVSPRNALFLVALPLVLLDAEQSLDALKRMLWMWLQAIARKCRSAAASSSAAPGLASSGAGSGSSSGSLGGTSSSIPGGVTASGSGGGGSSIRVFVALTKADLVSGAGSKAALPKLAEDLALYARSAFPQLPLADNKVFVVGNSGDATGDAQALALCKALKKGAAELAENGVCTFRFHSRTSTTTHTHTTRTHAYT